MRLLQTLAAQHRPSGKKVVKRLKHGHRLVLQEEGMTRPLTMFKLADMQRPTSHYGQRDRMPSVLSLHTPRTELIGRFMAHACAYCGAQEGYCAVHHVHKRKDLKADKPWEPGMVALRRQPLVLCVECHRQLHGGTLPSGKRRPAA